MEMTNNHNRNYHVEIDFQQKHPDGEIACGDVFKSRVIKKEGRTILVLSDGIGHGIKANVLAILTTTMALNYSTFHTKPEIAAKIIMRALPKSSDGKENYATFTIIEIEKEGNVRIINYDNPPVVIIRNGQPFKTKEYILEVRGEENTGKVLRCREFVARKEDRMVFFTDGITQSGLGSSRYPMGWGQARLTEFAIGQIKRQSKIAASKLSRKILNQAYQNDHFSLIDDSSCGVIYFREPRNFMLITGPPFYKVKDPAVVNQIKDFKGKKAICGGTTAEIVARELDLSLKSIHDFQDATHPPKAELDGFEIVTEGLLTISKTEEILENYTSETRLGDSPADEIVRLLLDHDIIYIIAGTRINWAHMDPDQPIDLEIRKVVVKRLINLLEKKFFKEIRADFV
ncbi:MAG: SpoIIE family protein phosphatase [Mariniphaga sp.]|nr:SpoIIE family protein phosphatase [Mariniphaga sp.]